MMKSFWSKNGKGFCACMVIGIFFFSCLNEFHGDYNIGGKCIAFTCAL
jgi:predicted negative regulator of RcsB-dependent stress response